MAQDAADTDICDELDMDFDVIEQEEDDGLGWWTAGATEQGEWSDNKPSAASSAQELGAFQAQTSAPEHGASHGISQAQNQAEPIAIHESSGVTTFAVVVKSDTGADSCAIARLPDHEHVLYHQKTFAEDFLCLVSLVSAYTLPFCSLNMCLHIC